MPRRRFFWQLFVGWGLLLAAVIVACFWLASLQLARLADEAQLRRMTDAAASLAARLPAEPRSVAADDFAAAAAEISRTAGVTMDLLDPQGATLLNGPAAGGAAPRAADSGWPMGSGGLVAEARAGRVAHASRYDVATDRRILAAAVPVGPVGQLAAIIRVSADTGVADRELAAAQRRLLTGSAAALLGALAAAYGLARRAARPVRELAQAAGRVAGGSFESRLPVPEAAELADLATALDALREQLVERGLTIGRQGTQQEAVLGSMIEGVLAVDARQRIVSINQGAADLLGLEAHAVLLKPLQEVVRNPDLRRFALLAIDCREPVEDDIILRGVRDRTIRVRGTALRDVSGEGGAVIVLNDVTDLQRLENVRRDFVANVSHELKTPISSIRGFVETLLDGAAEDPVDRQRFLEIIARQADRLESIIEDLLALSRIEQTEGAGNLPVESVPLAAVLAEAVADCRPRAAEHDVAIETSCDAALMADVNAALLEQAVINLVDNAVKYSAPGRTVWVSAGLDDSAPDGLTVAVRDEGCGIAADHLPRLFERFYRVDKARSRKLGGTGLGLSIVKHIVQAHGGTVAVESEPGVGSTFTIRLPAAAARKT
jgi:two-component system phosphate regulon sensor histidine kinase PhoR